MTVIRPNSISGITSITAQANEINVFRSNGLIAGLNLNGVNFNTTAGISTLAALKVTGNVDIAGVLTYQDVTNVDSLGIGTFRTGINVSGGQLDVGSNIKLGNAGVITATSFVGSGANLTSLPAQATIANNADNRVITGGSGVNLNGEANLTFDGSTLTNTGGAGAFKKNSNNYILVGSTDAGGATVIIDGDSNGDGSGADYAYIQHDTSGNLNIVATNPADSSNMIFNTGDGSERLRILSDGRMLLGTTSANHYSDRMFTINRDAGAGIELRNNGSSTGQISFSDTSGSGIGAYRGYIQFQHNNGSMHFATQSTERLRILSTSQLLHQRTDNTTRYDFEFRNTGAISDGNYGGILWTQGATGSTNLAALQIAYASTGQPDIVFKTRQGGGATITDSLRIHKNGDLSMPVVGSKLYTNNSGGNLTIQGGATYPGAAIKLNGGTNGGTGVMHFYAGNSTSYEERMKITAAGYVTHQDGKKCAFNVKGSNMTRNDTSGYVCQFNNDTSSGCFDSGNNFNTSTYKFVAPVSGYYYFFTNIRLDSFNSGYIRTAILSTSYHAGTTYYAIPSTGHVIDYYHDPTNILHISTSTVMYLPATHEAWVYQDPSSDSSYTCYLNESSFGGYFIG